VQKKQPNPTKPRFRISGDSTEFETERHLEWFFQDTVLPHLGIKILANQYSCKVGICDILAIGVNCQLIIIELKNSLDTNVFEQITTYFDALAEEKPFGEKVNYDKPIELYTVCPMYGNRTLHVLKYHKLDFTVLTYKIEDLAQNYIFTLQNWVTKEEITRIEILKTLSLPQDFQLPDPPKSFINLLGKCSNDQREWVIQIRDQVYEFAQNHNYKISETTNGKATRFQRSKPHPIAEVDWDTTRETLTIYLWLPFTTINGRFNMQRAGGENYKRKAMMRIWVVDGRVSFVGFIANGRKSWLVVTGDELHAETFPLPTKLQKHMRYKNGNHYWKGLAMPTQYYLKTMQLPNHLSSLGEFVNLALEYALQRSQKR
jgi:hypothetical protein